MRTSFVQVMSNLCGTANIALKVYCYANVCSYTYSCKYIAAEPNLNCAMTEVKII